MSEKTPFHQILNKGSIDGSFVAGGTIFMMSISCPAISVLLDAIDNIGFMPESAENAANAEKRRNCDFVDAL